MTSKDILMGSFGKEADPSSHGRQMPNHYGSKEHNIVSFSSTVSTQMPLATGVGYAAQLQKADFVALTTTGEGSANQGEVQEAMNFAGVKKLPVIFVVENNEYAISVQIEEQYANKRMADRAKAYGFEGVTVDGSDFAEVYLAFKEAVKAAYRSKEEIEEMKKNDAVKLFEKQLLEEGYLTDEDIAKIDEEIRAEINQATDEAEAMPDPVPTSILEEVYAK